MKALTVRVCYIIGAIPSHNKRSIMVKSFPSFNEPQFKDLSVLLYEPVATGTHVIISV